MKAVRSSLGPVLAAVLCAITPARGSAQASSAKVWENYDFVPGNKVLFYTDFSEDVVGNFARGLKYVSGPAEIVEREGVKVLRATGRAEFQIPIGRKLPSRFTIEIDVLTALEPPAGYDIVAFEGGPEMDRGDNSAEINWSPEMTMIIGGKRDREQRFADEVVLQAKGVLTHLRVLVDGPYLKMYANERRIHNIPELPFKRDAVIRVSFKGGEEDNATFLTGVRVAESETDILYDALSAKGRWATQGIMFATGKADLQPESRPVLKEIAATLKQHADLKILIEGHTDNVGSAASNLALSEARAAAVKGGLVAEFGVDGNRITTKGFGDTKPSVPNTSAAGRAQNRRVEIVKQ
ncbi:MAG TPA: OmpA family protein [Gemmatimonadaceae bacterium]|jgi:outer membrane protein OmpA-like peptidoglycan-associated protein|nr:OmpA family protein [Gemmatimonadaceae bacterium]